MPLNFDSATSVLDTPPEVEQKPAPTATTQPRATRTLPRRSPKPLFVDIETIPDYERGGSTGEKFGLEPLRVARPKSPRGDCPDIEAARANSVDDLKKLLRECNPEPTWLADFTKAEKAGKNRKGVFDVIDELENDDKVVAALAKERRKLLSVTPEFCKIISLAAARGEEPTRAAVVGTPYTDMPADLITEAMILESFWAAVAESDKIITFNGLHFDLPVILIRSAFLKVKPSRKLDLRPWSTECIDLMAVRWPKGGQKGLKDFCRFFGGPHTDDDMDGSQVEETYQKDPAKVGVYNAYDVDRTRWMYDFLRGYFV